jgi:hypothetical protein
MDSSYVDPIRRVAVDSLQPIRFASDESSADICTLHRFDGPVIRTGGLCYPTTEVYYITGARHPEL